MDPRLGRPPGEGLPVAYRGDRVASEGYRGHFESRGVPGERMAVTGMPNFDDCRRYLRNDFPHRGYVLVTQYSSTVFVGLALGKECHSHWDLSELRRLMPIQNGCAARNVAAVCRDVLAESPARQREAPSLPGFALPEAEAS
jgi:hypothetical protein